MKMYEGYESIRDHINRYCEPQDALVSLFLPNEYNPPEESNTSPVDYLQEFQGIDSTATSKELIFKTTDPDEDTDEWKSKEMKDWTNTDVLHWIASVAESQKFPYELVNANAFNVEGKALLTFSKKDFTDLDEKYGGILYQALQKIIPRFEEMSTPLKPETEKPESKLETLSTSTNLSEEFISYAVKKEGPPYGLVSGPNPYLSELTNSPESYPFELGSGKDDGDTSSEEVSSSERKNSSDTSFSSDTEQSDVEFKKQSKKSGATGKRPPGRPPGVKAKKEKPEKKTGRLWEFIRDLLLDPQHCPSVICWENHDDGVFRFVKSEKVAKIWGDRKGNEKMNYEKLSRAMRYYYRSKVLQPVIGRRLVYKFGPTARGWKTENPNFRQ